MEKISNNNNEEKELEICGTIVGISTPNEFLIAMTPASIQVQDLIAVDTDVKVGNQTQKKRVWAKVMSIERLNPLFPRESAQEIAYEQIQAIDTIASISRDMITARCKILGIDKGDGSFDILGYPIKPTSPVYRPKIIDVQKIILGQLKEGRSVKIGHLKTRDEINVALDGHFIVSRHLAILAMTGAGKTVSCRKIVEELIDKNYPILIFDPHEDYVNLTEYSDKVEIYVPDINLQQEDEIQIVKYIEDFSGEDISDAQERVYFNYLSILKNENKRNELQDLLNSTLGTSRNLKLNTIWDIRNLNDLILNYRDSAATKQQWNSDLKPKLAAINGSIANSLGILGTFYRIKAQTRKAAQTIANMKKISKHSSEGAKKLPPPTEIGELIKPGKVSIILFSGYSVSIRQSFTSAILFQLLNLRIENQIPRFLIVLEEAQNFVPSKSEGIEVKSSVGIVKQIATEGRKFGIGLILISQRPSRVDPTVLSQCNSYLIMRIVNPADQSYIRSTIETIGKEEINLLPSLTTGEAIVSGQCVNFPILVKIEKAKTEGVYEETDAFDELKKWKSTH